MSDKKVYYTFLGFLAVVIAVMSYARVIFPIMGDAEYFVDKNNIIHNKNCPYKNVPWFTAKHNKYNFIKETEQEFCDECFLDEEVYKLKVLSEINLADEALRLERAGASKDYIETKLGKYGY